MTIRFIFTDVPIDDMILAMRAVKWLSGRPDNLNAILAFGEGPDERHFYVRRCKSKSSITVRPC
jgi:hypothetical protein